MSRRLQAFRDELAKAQTASGDAAWRHLERAHILSQPYALPHVLAHAVMLRLALRNGDAREFLGQIVRLLVAAPGSWTGRFPHGNTGRATVGLFVPMDTPEDLAALLEER